jgi:hypothetical protein
VPTRYAPNTHFDPDVAVLMHEAFTAAWESARTHGGPEMLDGKGEWARETLALRIIERAQAGERDAKRLQLDALAHLANAKLQNRA